MQRVEQKVRVQLHLEGIELGLRQLRLELGGFQLSGPQTRLILDRMTGDQDQPVHRDAERDPKHGVRSAREDDHQRLREGANDPDDEHLQERLRDGEEPSRWNVQQQAARQTRGFEREPPRQKPDHRNQRRPRIPEPQLRRKLTGPADGRILHWMREPFLHREEQADETPAREE